MIRFNDQVCIELLGDCAAIDLWRVSMFDPAINDETPFARIGISTSALVSHDKTPKPCGWVVVLSGAGKCAAASPAQARAIADALIRAANAAEEMGRYPIPMQDS